MSLVQTAEGSLNEVHSMLQRIRELAVQYQNGTLSTSDKTAIASEVAQLTAEIERIGTTAQFNGINLLNSASTISFQVGANDGDVIGVALVSLGSAAAVTTLGGTTALSAIDDAIDKVSAERAQFGAVQDRLEHTLNNWRPYQENLTSSDSQIKDVDMASEMVNFTKLQVLQQAGTAMLAQANQAPQSILQLLR